MLKDNIFRNAKQLLRDKTALERTEEEQAVIDTASLPFMMRPML